MDAEIARDLCSEQRQMLSSGNNLAGNECAAAEAVKHGAFLAAF
jgi:hypothetical protein